MICLLSLTCNRFITKGVHLSSNMSLWNASAPGEYPVTLKYCFWSHVKRRPIRCQSISLHHFKYQEVLYLSRFSKHSQLLGASFCKYHFQQDCGYVVVGVSFVPKAFSNFWNPQSVNSPPSAWQREKGRGYLDNQDSSNFSATCSDVLLSILIGLVM